MADVGDSTAENLVRYGGCVALSQKDKLNHVKNGISFPPLEITVRNVPGAPLKLNKKSRNGVGDNGTLGVKDLVSAQAASFDTERVLEIGKVGADDLEKVDAFVRSEAVALANKTIDKVELFLSLRFEIGPWCTSDDSDDLIFVFAQQFAGLLGEFDPGDAELSGPQRTR